MQIWDLTIKRSVRSLEVRTDVWVECDAPGTEVSRLLQEPPQFVVLAKGSPNRK